MRLICADYDSQALKDIESHLQSLLAPKNSHMDFNIACALHYASKGEGYRFNDEYFEDEAFKEDFDKITQVFESKVSVDRGEEMKKGNTKAKSFDYGMITSAVKRVDPNKYRMQEWIKGGEEGQGNAKVVFSGLGADEVFCGYARYKTSFERGGIKEMEEEMGMDLDRLWHRNMGRDDRAISDNGKEARFPFLDAQLMRYLGKHVESNDLADWTAFRGLADKKLLRVIAKEEFGIKFASLVEKRAI